MCSFATVSACALAGEPRMWLCVPCQLGTGSKAPPGSTDSSIQSFVTPAAIPAHNSSHHSPVNTEYWDIKELNKLEMLCWTPRAACLAGSCSLPTASLTELALFQVCSKIRQNSSLFFPNQNTRSISSLLFQENRILVSSCKTKIPCTVRKFIS